MPEPGSDAFNALVAGRDDVLISDLAVSEAVSALARRQRQGHLARDTAASVQRALLQRLETAPHHRLELTRETHRRAERLLMTLTAVPLRAADALHLALATSAHARSFASFDGRLAAAARITGLTVHPG